MESASWKVWMFQTLGVEERCWEVGQFASLACQVDGELGSLGVWGAGEFGDVWSRIL